MKHKKEWNRLLSMICCLTLVLFMVPTLRPWAVDGSAAAGLHGDGAGAGTEDGETEESEETETEGEPGESEETETEGKPETEDGSGAEEPETENMGEPEPETEEREQEVGSAVYGAVSTYIDLKGNSFAYTLDEDGNAVIIEIEVSGQELVIPESINGAAVVEVGNEDDSCVVVNPETEIDSLYINCERIGAFAFSGIKVGELTIGLDVRYLSESLSDTYSLHCWEQFAGAEVGTLHFESENLLLEHGRAITTLTYSMRGPFYQAAVSGLDIGSSVRKIPEAFLYGASMELDALEIQVPEIGAFAFSGEAVDIGELTIGSGIVKFTESYGSSASRHEWSQFTNAAIGTLRMETPELLMEHMAGSGVSISVFPPFEKASITSLEIGAGVELIPECFFYNAKMDLDELEIHVSEIGAYAFSGKDISFDTLMIGREVSVFSEYCFGTSSTHQWCTFSQTTIGHLIYAAEEAVVDNTVIAYGTSYTGIYGPPFMQAQIGELSITEDVKCIPDYFLYKAKADFDEVYLDMPVIGAMAFMGPDMKIRSLTIGEHVTTFSRVKYNSSSSYLWEQFEEATVGDVYFNAVSSELDRAASDGSYYHGPFYKTKVDTLHFGSAVEVIPAYCFNEVIMEQDELEIHAKTIGQYAFCSEKVLIEELTIGTEVETLSCQKSGSMMYFKQFAGNKIGTLYYEPAAAETGTYCYGGVFNKATIGEVVFADGVEVIPNYLFYNAIIDFGDCVLDMPTIGYYSFYGDKISFSTLTLGEHVASFPVNSSNYNRAFYYNRIGCLRINTPSIRLLSVHGPFSASVQIGTLEIGECVDYLDCRLFYNVSVDDCFVYPVEASEEFAGQSLSYFPVSKNLYIHYNSDFKPLFAEKAAGKDWLCKDCYELSYGETVYDEVSDEYLMEVIRHCPVCGHEEISTEELDDSYSLFISLPVEITLSFSAVSKSYEGWGQVLVYGEIGNAYSAAKVVVDKERDEYGTARKGESVIDISPFLSTGFCEGEEAVFPAFNLRMNKDAVEHANVEGFYTDDLTVTVLGYAFLMSGAGEYRIPIPLKVVVY